MALIADRYRLDGVERVQTASEQKDGTLFMAMIMDLYLLGGIVEEVV